MIWHSSEKNQVLNYFNVDAQNGISSAKAEIMLNDIRSTELESNSSRIIKTLTKQFGNRTYVVLLVSILISVIVSLIAKVDIKLSTIMIIAVIAIFGFFTLLKNHFIEKFDSENETYKKYSACVIRDGQKITIKTDEIVTGDILVLNAGDYIPADARLIEAVNFRCDEYILTGETVYVDKDADVTVPDISEIKERYNMVFAGCSVMTGQALAVVTETACETELAKQKINKSYLYEDRKSQVEQVCKYSGIIIAAVCAIIFILNIIFSGTDSDQNFALTVINSVILCAATAIACYPESLPSIVSAIKSMGIKKLHSVGIIVLNQSVIKKVSKISVICADKGEVFTKETLKVAKLYNGKKLSDISEGIDEEDALLLKLSALCFDENNPSPTDEALFSLCENELKINKDDFKNLYPALSIIPFDNERKLITTINMVNGKPFAIVKGAPEILIQKCNGINSDAALKMNDALATEALKVIAVGYKELGEAPVIPNSEELENGLIFAGYICFQSELSDECKSTVKALNNANIRTILITGDNLATAKAIAEKAGLLENNLKCITDEELSAMSDEELDKEVTTYAVFARISPENRFRIVRALQHNNEKVAITGNSVYDAPSLRKAALGIALKSTSSDVAKDAADLIIEDTSLSSILTAIATCKNVYFSIKKTLHYILSSNLAELLTVLLGLIIFRIPVLLAVQLLFVNLITDVFPALSIGMAPIDTVKITNDKSRIFTLNSSIKIAIEAILITIFSVINFSFGISYSPDVARTLVFAFIGFSQILHIISCYSDAYIWKSGILKNKYIIFTTVLSVLVMLLSLLTPFGALFDLTALPADCILKLILMIAIFFALDELLKFATFLYRKRAK